ncbi:MAG: class I SAM-dependent methyltransferase, partial [Acidobacteria bacterium]|nr:class I SAM-dependent methyltransferase [Acidobacteriota bacterium]
TNDRIDRPTSDPYTGDLARFDREKRAEKLQIERVMDILGIKAGSIVADIGAGGGWFTVIAAKRVGEQGKVFAVDINKESKGYIDGRAEKEGLSNITSVQSKPEDPLLPDNTVEGVLILNTYHEFSEPVTIMKNLRRALKKGALVGIIDRNGSGDDHGIDSEKVIGEVERAGYVFKDSYDFVKPANMDYFLVFAVEEPGKIQ